MFNTLQIERLKVPEQSIEQQSRVLEVLAYFDIFHYPLLSSEIRLYLSEIMSIPELTETLQSLEKEKRIFHMGDFYALHSNYLLVERRIEGNRRAHQLLPRAFRNGRFLFRFPFVRAIGISGSLSKHFADERADIDFFIITKTNRLWIARTCMHLFKKIMILLGKQHGFCMNYYLDESSLKLKDQNIYTAIELKTLLPVRGNECLARLLANNPWTESYLPACNRSFSTEEKKKPHVIKKWIEWVFDNRLGDRLDDLLWKITSRRWNKKETKGKRNNKGLTHRLDTGKHFARSNPGSFQERVLELYQEKLTKCRM
ncbi:MAG TPA: hypothetical protein VLJ68_00075 [Chitinophagaceae bacterium]|nr:hypothetical protein [Chitinophagaceae bacterium]